MRSGWWPRPTARKAGCAAILCASAVLLLPEVAGAWVPRSGDVDRDGRKTTRDAVLIMESAGWPEADRQRLRGWMEACDVTANGVCDATDAYEIFVAVISDWNDYDSDGVPNAGDCAIFDDRLATPHTYFLDRDLDHIGSPDRVLQCTIAPQPPLVAWDGDPDDYSVWAVAPQVARGSRLLGLDLNDAPESGAWRPELARELGADAALLRIDWGLVESAPGVYSGPQVQALAIAGVAYPASGLQLALAVNPLSQGYLAVPADLRGEIESGRLRLNDPVVVNRFKDLLTYVHGSLSGVTLVSLQLGYEVDRFFARAGVPGYFWADYAELVFHATQHAKALWGSGLRVAVTATHHGLLHEPSRTPLMAINSLVDVVSATYLPPGAGTAGIEPADLRIDLQQLVALAYPKPLHLQAVEYPSAPAAGGSETRQSQFIRAVFDIWDQYGEALPYIGFGRLHDRSPGSAGAQAGALGVDAVTLGSVGLRTWGGDGRAKTAYKTLRNLAFERGWWRMEPPATRSFEMGFTQALYDAPPEPQAYVAMLDWIYSAARQDGTFFNLHLDSGVPWLEAAADDFSWPEPPYSPYLRASWQSHRERLPPGQKLMVSVNPTGVPRDVLAPYFGVGEGFIYDENFERVGDGIISDYENRLPPFPWSAYSFDHPDVKRAFTTYCRRVIQYFSPDYLIVAVETTATMHQDPAAFDRLVALIQHVRADLESRPETRDVKLLVSLSATSFMVDEYGVALKREEQAALKREHQIQGVFDLAPYVDGFALSHYPHYSKWNATFMPASMFDELWDLLGEAGKPAGFSETGWPAETFDVLGSPFFSDPAKQARFLRLLFAESEKAPVPIEFVVNFRTRDGDLQWQRLLNWSLEQPPKISPQFVEFYEYFRDIGIFDGNGNARPATSVWREYLARPYVPRVMP